MAKVNQATIIFWENVIKDNETMTPTEIAAKYVNPRTGKNYTREHIHWILKYKINDQA